MFFDQKGKLIFSNYGASRMFPALFTNSQLPSFNETLKFIEKTGTVLSLKKKLEFSEIFFHEYSRKKKCYTIGIYKIHTNIESNQYGYLISQTELSQFSDNEPDQTELLSMAAQRSPSSVIYTDANRKVIWVNKSFTRNTGYSLKDVKGKIPGQLRQGKDTSQDTIAYTRKQLSENKTAECEILYYRKDGKPIWMKLHIVPVLTVNGQVEYYLGIAANLTQQKELEKKLSQQRAEEQRNILQNSIKAQEKERNLLGRELHDNINQLLSASLLYNAMIKEKSTAKALSELQEKIIQSAIHEIRALSHRLITPDSGTDFKEDIKNLVSQVFLDNSVSVNVQLPKHLTGLLNTEYKLQLFRITQEQFTNIIKHANASRVTIELSKTENDLVLTITDNGTGVDPALAGNGIGLSNIANRCKLIYASYTVNTSKRKGFSLLIKIPQTPR